MEKPPFVVYVLREDIIRVISARLATKTEALLGAQVSAKA
jgi:uncharacterized DUF497 family protein